MLQMSQAAAVAAVMLLTAACASQEKPAGPAVFYPPAPEEPRLQFLAQYSRAEDVELQSSGFARFVAGEDVERKRGLGKPYGVAWAGGRIYVCDTSHADVTVFDLDAKRLRSIDPDGVAKLVKPTQVAVAPDGFKYVTDTTTKHVLVYDASDRYVTAFGDPSAWKPVGVAATADRVYVTDVQNHRLVALDRRTGKEVLKVGERGKAPGKFYFPLAVCVGPDGDVYVADSFNWRIQRLKPDGTFVRAYGKLGPSPGDFTRLRGIAVDREGRLYAVDAAFENVQIFDPEGHLLLFFGEPGGKPGDINLPASISIDYDAAGRFRDLAAPGYDIEYVVFVTSQFGPNKVNVYGFLKKRG